MIRSIRAMPIGIRIFLVYAFLILTLIGLSLRWVVDQAINAPISPQGAVVMVLLAYTIFTITMVLQRKAAAYNLALGLASLTIPGIVLLFLFWGPVGGGVGIVLAAAILGSLRRETVRTYLSEV